jgi:hypothetical protein
MSKQSWSALFAAVALIMIAGKVHAATYTEGAVDARQTRGTASIASTQPFGTPLDAITGMLTANNADLFQIFISDPATFSANTFFMIPGVNNFNTALFLFDSAGFGVYANDDAPAPANGSQSQLPTGNSLSPKTAGIYYIAVSGAGYAPISADGLIFPTPNSNSVPFNAILDPTGVGGAKILSDWTGNGGSNTGAYKINLTGATFVPSAIPEPTMSMLLPSVIALGGVASLKRRSRSKV